MFSFTVDDEYHDEDGFLDDDDEGSDDDDDVDDICEKRYLLGEFAREQERLFVSEQADHWSSNLAS